MIKAWAHSFFNILKKVLEGYCLYVQIQVGVDFVIGTKWSPFPTMSQVILFELFVNYIQNNITKFWCRCFNIHEITPVIFLCAIQKSVEILIY